MNLYRYAANPLTWIDPLGLLKCGLTGDEVGNASNLKVIKPGTKEWSSAVSSIKNGGKSNFRVASQEDAAKLMQQGRGNIERMGSAEDPYNDFGSAYKKGYEIHPNESNTINAPENDLSHVKWKDWSTGKSGGGAGHVFF